MRSGRDFGAEQDWLLNLAPSPETDRLQDKWESDPLVKRWRQEQERERHAKTH